MPATVGHVQAREALVLWLPPVTLLAGPPHIGKKTLAAELAAAKAQPVDRLWAGQATVEAVAAAARFALTAPAGRRKVVVICLDGASPAALAALLRLLEEAPGACRFILTAAVVGWDVPATLFSRASVFNLRLLPDAQVEMVLRAHGMEAGQAAAAAAASGGQVRSALEADPAVRAAVVAALRAAAQGDAVALGQAMHGWDDVRQRMLATWCCEAISGRWRAFRPVDSQGLGPAFARRLLTSLAPAAGARVGLAATVALEHAARTR